MKVLELSEIINAKGNYRKRAELNIGAVFGGKVL